MKIPKVTMRHDQEYEVGVRTEQDGSFSLGVSTNYGIQTHDNPNDDLSPEFVLGMAAVCKKAVEIHKKLGSPSKNSD